MKRIEDALEKLPAVLEHKPVAEMTTSELLHAAVRRGLQETLAVLSQPMRLKRTEDDELSESDLKLMRIKVDATTSAARLMASIEQAALRPERTDKLKELLEKLRKADEEKARERPPAGRL